MTWHPVSQPRDGEAVAPSASPELEERAQPPFDAPDLSPAKPPRPSAAPPAAAPTPIEADAAELVPAVTMPDAAETFPTAPVTTEIEVDTAAADAPLAPVHTSPYLAAFTEPRPPKGTVERDGELTAATDGDGEVVDPAATASAPIPSRPRKLPPSAVAMLAASDLPVFDDDPAFVPEYKPAAADEAPQSPLAHATLEESHEPAYAPLVPAPRSVDDDTPPAAPPEDTMADTTREDTIDTPADDPTATSPPVADAGDGEASPPPPEDGDHGKEASGSFWSSTVFLVIVGVLVMAGIGYGVYALFFQPTTVALPAQTVVTVPAEPATNPIAVTDPSAFLAAMPTTVGAYALTEYTSQRADDEESIPEGTTLPDGVAEHVTLTYSDGTEQVVVDAWQHYDVGTAQATFEGLNVDGTNSRPVIVDGAEVGTQVDVASEAGPTVVWLNGTAVFSAGGGGDSLTAFVAGFGL